MDVYLFNKVTGEFLSVHKCQKSPLEPGVFLKPNNHTKIKPPGEKTGFARIFSGKKWNQVLDNRGQITCDDAGSLYIINALGEEIREPPNPDLIEPLWNGETFVETASQEFINEKADQKIRAKYAVLMSDVAKPYSSQERETWFLQREAAEIYVTDETIEPYIQIMADARGIPVETLLEKIQENIDLYNSVIFDLLGKQQKEIDELG